MMARRGFLSGPVRPVLSMGVARLGQMSAGLVRELVDVAEPKFRRIVSEERTRLAEAAKSGIPFAALATATFLASTYLVPPKQKAVRIAGYGVSAGLGAIGLWRVLDLLTEDGAPGPGAPAGGESPLARLTQPVASQFAQEIVEQAEPRVRAIVDDETARAAEAARSALPWAGISAASWLGTAYFVPDVPALKAAGYAVAAGFLLWSLWSAFDVSSDLERTAP